MSLAKVAKQFRKQAAKAERFASASSAHSEGLSNLAAAFRAQAEVLKQAGAAPKKIKKKKRKTADADCVVSPS
ncbi:MAG: hypothetical protein K2W78_09745 [Xanthobacteraceae bacterium]|nr:hypothetical protein [Xanthobacteraceae bacterium]